jgi:hypothetical protein
MKNMKLKTLAAALMVCAAGSAAATGYEVWMSDQGNTNGYVGPGVGQNQAGSNGGMIRIYDSADLEQAAPVNNPTNLNVTAVFPNAAANTGTVVNRIHGMLPSPNHNYMNVNFVASGHVGIIDARTKAAVALFRTTGTNVGDKDATGAAIASSTASGRQNHMSFWSPDGSYLIVANQFGKLLERIDITWDADRVNIVSAVFNKGATLDLAGDMTSRVVSLGVAGDQSAVADVSLAAGSVAGVYVTQSKFTPNGIDKQKAGVRPNNTVICPIASSDGRHAYVTLGGGGQFVVDYTATPMQIVAEYDMSKVRAAGCGGMEGGGFIHLNAGTPSAGKSEFTIYRFPLNYPNADGNGTVDSGEFYPVNVPAPKVLFQDVDNGKLNLDVSMGDAALRPRDAHGMSKNSTRSFLHQFDRVRNQVEVINMGTLARTSYSLEGSSTCAVNVGAESNAGVAGATASAPFTLPAVTNAAAAVIIPAGKTYADDPTPDLLDLSPNGDRFFVAMRGPFPNTIGHAAVGSCPGLGIVQLTNGGKSGVLQAVLPTFIDNLSGKNMSDPHGAAIRIK